MFLARNLIFLTWLAAGIGVLAVGGQFLFSPPDWTTAFPNIWVAYGATMVFPTLLLSLPALRWLTKEGNA